MVHGCWLQGGRGGGSCCGVFVGILALVGTVVSVTVSLVLSIIDVIQLTQLVLSLAACLTSLMTLVHVCGRRTAAAAPPRAALVDLLLLASLAGVVALASFDALAAHDERQRTSVVVSVVVVAQSVFQTGVVAVAVRRRVPSTTPSRACSWRQTVALLAACTVSMWLMEVLRCAGLTTHSSHAVRVYTARTYHTIVLVLAPVAIFHRFVTVVCLLVMWKQTTVHTTTVL